MPNSSSVSGLDRRRSQLRSWSHRQTDQDGAKPLQPETCRHFHVVYPRANVAANGAIGDYQKST